jgi:elongation factor P
MEVSVDFIEGKPVSVNLPTQVVLTVVEADPVVKGQTAASSYKPGLLENGLKVLIPPFIEAGTKIVVATEDCSYVERAK